MSEISPELRQRWRELADRSIKNMALTWEEDDALVCAVPALLTALEEAERALAECDGDHPSRWERA